MKFLSLKALLFILLLSTVSNGQTWTSPDGFISVTPPDARQFQELPNPPPPLVILWVSNDESMKFGIVRMDMPANVKLIQSSLEEGLAEEIGGKVTRLKTKTISGHEVLCMLAKAPTATVLQAIVLHDDVVYKLMAACTEDSAESDLPKQFIDSLSIATTTTQSKNEPTQGLVDSTDSDMFVHWVSKNIGGWSCILLIGLAIYFFIRRKRPPSGTELNGDENPVGPT